MNVPACAISTRATRAEIDLDALANNVRHFAALAAPNAAVMAVVKANAYGHGAVMVARTALAAGARWLAVATVDEGRQLRAAGITAPVLVLAPSDAGEAAAAVGADLTLAVGDLATAAAVAAAARAEPATVHVEIDTGLHRFGTPAAAAVETISQIAALPGLRLGGLYTHFATADETDRSFLDEQRASFAAVVAAVRAAGIAAPVIHADNSAAALTGPSAAVQLIRPGVALYGLSPSATVPAAPALRPVLTLRTRVARVIALAPGDSVSYGRTFIADRPMRAALVPLGYGDGYRRALSNQGELLLGGRPARVLGRVCMDQTVIAVPDGVAVAVGDDVVAIGAQGDQRVTADRLAVLAGTIPYEIGTGITSRVPRYYLRGSQMIAIEDLAGLRELPVPVLLGRER
ncbi:MAG: alanine racemase [Thermomicrobiales bacterium]